MRFIEPSIILLCSLLIALFQKSAYSYVPFLLIVTLFVSTYVLHRLYRQIEVTANIAEHYSQQVNIVLQLKKRRRLRVQGQYTIIYEHLIEKTPHQLSGSFSLNTQQHIQVPLPTTFCGQISIVAVHMTFSDPIDLYRTKKEIKTTATSIVLPRIRAVDLQQLHNISYRQIGHEAGAYERIIPYTPGDAVQHIHWPLSAKTQTLLVQKPAFAPTANAQFALYFNDISTVAQYDQFMSYCYSVLRQEDIQHVTIWQGDWQTIDVQSTADVEKLFRQLLVCSLTQLYAPSLPDLQYTPLRYEGVVTA